MTEPDDPYQVPEAIAAWDYIHSILPVTKNWLVEETLPIDTNLHNCDEYFRDVLDVYEKVAIKSVDYIWRMESMAMKITPRRREMMQNEMEKAQNLRSEFDRVVDNFMVCITKDLC